MIPSSPLAMGSTAASVADPAGPHHEYVLKQVQEKETGHWRWKAVLRTPRAATKDGNDTTSISQETPTPRHSQLSDHHQHSLGGDATRKPLWGSNLIPTLPRIPPPPISKAQYAKELRLHRLGNTSCNPSQEESIVIAGLGGSQQMNAERGPQTAREQVVPDQGKSTLLPWIPNRQPQTARSGAMDTHLKPRCQECAAKGGGHLCEECAYLEKALEDFEVRLSTKYALVSGLSSEVDEPRPLREGQQRMHGGGKSMRKITPQRSGVFGSPGTGSRREATRDRVALPSLMASTSGTHHSSAKPHHARHGGTNTHAILKTPIHGLLCGVPLPKIREAFDELALQKRSVTVVGLSIADFGELLKKIVPQMPLSAPYVEHMFDGFDTTMNNATRRLNFFAFFPLYGTEANSEAFDRNLKLFFSQFEVTPANSVPASGGSVVAIATDPPPPATSTSGGGAPIALGKTAALNLSSAETHLPLGALDPAHILTFIETKELRGTSKAAWSGLANALAGDDRLSFMRTISASKLAAVQLRKKKESRGRKSSNFVKKFVNVSADRELKSALQDPLVTGQGGSFGDEHESFSVEASSLQYAPSSVVGSATTAVGSTHSMSSSSKSNIEPSFTLTLSQFKVLVFGSEALMHAFNENLWIPPKQNLKAVVMQAHGIGSELGEAQGGGKKGKKRSSVRRRSAARQSVASSAESEY